MTAENSAPLSDNLEATKKLLDEIEGFNERFGEGLQELRPKLDKAEQTAAEIGEGLNRLSEETKKLKAELFPNEPEDSTTQPSH